MDTSTSADGDTWVAGALVFSGRRDPTWPVPVDLGRHLEQVWQGLPTWSGERPHPPPLGYHGCTLTSPDGRVWTAFRELVTQATDSRRDSEREFERSLIASAPPGVLPPISA